MKILLINNNPVVSRLTALSARKENIEIDEIQEVTELSSDGYDILFVDADSLTKDVNDIIKEHLKVKKTVLFYADGDEEDKSTFDLTILKPFLPSEVSAVIRTVEEIKEEQKEKHFNVLDEPKESDTDELFALNDFVEIKDEPVEVKTKDSFDEKLEEAFPLKINMLEDELFEEIKDEKEPVIKDSKAKELFELDISDDTITLDDELFSKEVTKSNKILDFEVDIDKLKLDELEKEEKLLKIEEEPLMIFEDKKENIEVLTEEVKEKEKLEENVIETKILDKNEIENIKGLLTEDTNDEMTLDDLMTPPVRVENIEDEEKKSKKRKEKKENLSIESDVLVQSLSGLSIESLRELLAGARVNINIKFPKAK